MCCCEDSACDLTLASSRNKICERKRQVKVRGCKSVLCDNASPEPSYEGWNFNSGNYLFTTDTK